MGVQSALASLGAKTAEHIPKAVERGSEVLEHGASAVADHASTWNKAAAEQVAKNVATKGASEVVEDTAKTVGKEAAEQVGKRSFGQAVKETGAKVAHATVDKAKELGTKGLSSVKDWAHSHPFKAAGASIAAGVAVTHPKETVNTVSNVKSMGDAVANGVSTASEAGAELSGKGDPNSFLGKVGQLIGKVMTAIKDHPELLLPVALGGGALALGGVGKIVPMLAIGGVAALGIGAFKAFNKDNQVTDAVKNSFGAGKSAQDVEQASQDASQEKMAHETAVRDAADDTEPKQDDSQYQTASQSVVDKLHDAVSSQQPQTGLDYGASYA